MNIKLEDIRDKHPCESGWKKLIRSLDGRTEGNVSLSHILDSNGIEDAVWCLRVLPYRDQCLFRADVAELTVHLCDDLRPQVAIVAIRVWHAGDISDESLAADAADAAAYDATGLPAAAYAVTAVTDTTDTTDTVATYTAGDISDESLAADAAAAAAAAAATYAATYAATTAADAAYAAYAAAYAAAAAAAATWLKITTLFKKHYCEEMK